MPSPSPALARKIEAALAAEAARVAAALLKRRARAYAARPAALDVIAPGLSLLAPEALVAAGRAMLSAERRAPRRWAGFGAEAPLINAGAVVLLGRTLRRAARGERVEAGPRLAEPERRSDR